MKVGANGGITIEGDSTPEVISLAIHTFYESDLETVRSWALSHLSIWRGEKRSTVGLRPAAFQDFCYMSKVTESQRWLANQTTEYALSSEATLRGKTNEELANLIIDKWNTWLRDSSNIEISYYAAKDAINEAVTIDEIKTALINLYGG